MRKIVYISGPIINGGKTKSRKTIDANIGKACRAAQQLIEAGFSPICPHLTVYMEDVTGVQNDHDIWMEIDRPQVEMSDYLIRLPGASRGADLEVEWATKIGIPVFGSVKELVEFRLKEIEEQVGNVQACFQGRVCITPLDSEPEESITAEAERIVHGTRQQDYGHPREDFARTAGMWKSLFGWDVKVEDVPRAMICVKLSRDVNAPKRDNRTDIAGYAETLDLLRREPYDGPSGWAYRWADRIDADVAAAITGDESTDEESTADEKVDIP